ncbi:MAG TPA: tetratricopeptide repeat protein [Nitrospiria bacterium]|nr:tetratricopeptide repeat protein [Nitrospiria bacterium]
MYLRFIIAGFIAISLVSCATTQEDKKTSGTGRPANDYNQTRAISQDWPVSLESAALQFRNGKYSEALMVYRKVARNGNTTEREFAQYQTAFTLSYFKNSHRDYQEALTEFQIFVKRYPESKLKAEALNWISILQTHLNQKNENQKLKADIQKLVDIDLSPDKKK